MGAADGEPGKNGVAHFLEHLMFKGTARLKPGEFSKTVNALGGSGNAFTNQDITVYHEMIAKEHLPAIMAMEADRMQNLVLDDATVLPERDVVLNERGERVENVSTAKLAEMANAAQFLNHPYRLPVLGWRQEIAAYTSADALAFYRRWYAPNNAILVVAGDVEPEEVRKLAETYFGPIPRRDLPERKRLTEPEHIAPVRISFTDPGNETRQIWRRYLAPSYGKGERRIVYALIVLEEILNSDSDHSLYGDFARDRALALSGSANYDPRMIDLSLFSFYLTMPRDGDPVALEAALDAKIAAWAKDGFDSAAVEQAKSRLAISAAKARDSLSGLALQAGSALANGRNIAEVQAWPEHIAAVTAADVTDAAREILVIQNSLTAILQPGDTPTQP